MILCYKIGCYKVHFFVIHCVDDPGVVEKELNEVLDQCQGPLKSGDGSHVGKFLEVDKNNNEDGHHNDESKI